MRDANLSIKRAENRWQQDICCLICWKRDLGEILAQALATAACVTGSRIDPLNSRAQISIIIFKGVSQTENKPNRQIVN